jgi:predicted dehydrogenase
MSKIRAAVIGAGSFGKNHVRVISQLEDVELAAIIDTNLEKASQLAREHHSQAFAGISEAHGLFDAAIVATPTITHEEITAQLLDCGVDVLVEKPIAASSDAGERLAQLAGERGRVLQVGHLERFNPAVTVLERSLTIPLFFEVHRLSVFTPRSLDIDVVLDLMIHDLDIVLNLTRQLPEEIRAAGISVLSPQVDIANVRLAFKNGCIANLTASRVSTEKVRKLRLFQPGEYISIDYNRQDAIRLAIKPGPRPSGGGIETGAIGFEQLPVTHTEPLQLELAAFFDAVRTRTPPKVDGFQAAKVLRVAEAILGKIKEHTDLVSETIGRRS